MKRFFWIGLLIFTLLIPVSGVSAAEEPDFVIRLNRDWGYGGMGNQIQGNFSLLVKEDPGLVRVTYLMDDIEMGSVSEAPFRFSFDTDDYPSGEHAYWAVGELPDGTTLTSNRIQVDVLTAEDANVDVRLILGIIFGTMAIGAILSWGVTKWISKKVETGEYFGEDLLPKGFNFRGGTICPNCGKPYAYKLFSMNLLTRKFDSCPHCGKWRVSKPVSREVFIEKVKELKGKTADEPAMDQKPLTEEEKLRRQLDDSRYVD